MGGQSVEEEVAECGGGHPPPECVRERTLCWVQAPSFVHHLQPLAALNLSVALMLCRHALTPPPSQVTLCPMLTFGPSWQHTGRGLRGTRMPS